MKPPLIIITGPTAVGKTSLSIALAKKINGEIISADSMQVYKHMDIGSAKITPAEMNGVKHHLIDILEPTDSFNVALFKELASAAVKEIYSRGHIPIVAGGTGFYIQALLYDIDFTENDGDTSIRNELEKLAHENGTHYMHEMLSSIDKDAAEDIHENNIKRVIRAIEYYRLTGEQISVHNRREAAKQSPYDFYYYVLNTDRNILYDRIERRVDIMLEKGLVNEVKKLIQMGCTKDMVSMQGLGYKEIINYLDGNTSFDEAVKLIKQETRHFAKRQLTWFRRERDVRMINLPDYDNNIESILQKIISDIQSVISGDMIIEKEEN